MRRDPNASRPTSVNFLPEWYRQRRRGRRMLRYQVLLLAGLVLVLGGLIGRQLRHGAELNQQHERIREQLESVREQSEGLKALRQTHRDLVQSLRVQRRLHRPIGYAEIAATLVDLVPEPVTLRRLRMAVEERSVRDARNRSEEDKASKEEQRDAPETSTRRVVTIQIEGVGPSDAEVSRFTGALASSPLFGDVEIGYWRQAEYEGLRARQFAVRTTVRLDRQYEAPVEEDEPAEVSDAR